MKTTMKLSTGLLLKLPKTKKSELGEKMVETVVVLFVSYGFQRGNRVSPLG